MKTIDGLWIVLVLVAATSGCGDAEQELGSATEHFLAAQEALAQGNKQLAIEELGKSIDLQPDPWAYYQRAQVYNELGDDAKALADCDAGLAMNAEQAEGWRQQLYAELTAEAIP